MCCVWCVCSRAEQGRAIGCRGCRGGRGCRGCRGGSLRGYITSAVKTTFRYPSSLIPISSSLLIVILIPQISSHSRYFRLLPLSSSLTLSLTILSLQTDLIMFAVHHSLNLLIPSVTSSVLRLYENLTLRFPRPLAGS